MAGILFVTVKIERVERAFVCAVLGCFNQVGVLGGSLREQRFYSADILLYELADALAIEFRGICGAVHSRSPGDHFALVECKHGLVEAVLGLQTVLLQVGVQRAVVDLRSLCISARRRIRLLIVYAARGILILIADAARGFGIGRARAGGTLVGDFVQFFRCSGEIFDSVGIAAAGAEEGECARDANVKLFHCCSPLCFW